MTHAILVIWSNGESEYLKEGLTTDPARFTLRQAREQRDFMLIGMEDEVQSINVVPFPNASRNDGSARKRKTTRGVVTPKEESEAQ